MKKYIFILLLMLTIVSSMVAGTLAIYTTSIDNLADGSVVAKEFIFVGEGTDTFQHGVKIAPLETVQWQFKIKNYENHVITETDLYYKIIFNINASSNKNAIEPLIVTVKDLNGNIRNSVSGVGTLDVLDSFSLSENGQEKDYIVEIYWPDEGNADTDYAGGNYGTSVNVEAIASQIPFGDTDPVVGNPDAHNEVSVRYETSSPWQNGQSGVYEFEYKVMITNNSDTTIEDWNIAFTLPLDKIIRAWSNANMVTGSSDGYYKFVNPNYNNTATDDILPGQSVSFRGPAFGHGTEAIENIKVGGSNINSNSNVDLTYEFGKNSLN
ncbi:MAG: sugar-binding protein [Firmicutes bacterium HGW-Firmicutes-7]|nr:MAG: sugar-binding protein [Firmicutes bacterium HGW-Firmicutes-7]